MARALPLRYALPNFLLIGGTIAAVLGGIYLWIWLALAAFIGIGLDEAVGDDRRDLPPASRTWFTANLVATLPLLILFTIAVLHLFAAADPIGLKAFVAEFGIAYGTAAPTVPLWLTAVAAVLLASQSYAAAGVSAGHELVHWQTNRAATIAGRVLMSFTLDSAYSISHLFGHHRNVGIWSDPSTPRRGETVYRFALRTTIGQLREAFTLEADRLRRRGYSAWSWRNRAIRGQLYSLALIGMAALIAGLAGVIVFVTAALLGRFVHLIITYCQHYGLVRAEGSPIGVRHSWDCARRYSNAMMYNSPRHAQHHVAGGRQAWELQAAGDGAPNLPHGYGRMIPMALLPWRFRQRIHPLLAEWDRRLATDGERELIRQRGWEIPEPAIAPRPSSAP